MTAHITLPPRRSPGGGAWWVAPCTCGHTEHGNTPEQARQAIKTHKLTATANQPTQQEGAPQ